MFKVVSEVPKPLLIVSSFCAGWMFVSSLYSKLLIWVPISFSSLMVPCIFFFMSPCIAFTFPSILRPYSTIAVSILITRVLNFESDRLAISLSLSSIFGALIYSFIWAFFFFFFFCLTHPLHYEGHNLTYSSGRDNSNRCMWGRGQRRNNATCWAITGLSVISPATSKLGPSGANSQVGGFVYILGPHGHLQWTLLWGREFPHHHNPHRFLQPEVFEASFFQAGTLGWAVSLAPQLFLPVYLHTNKSAPSLSSQFISPS